MRAPLAAAAALAVLLAGCLGTSAPAEEPDPLTPAAAPGPQGPLGTATAAPDAGEGPGRATQWVRAFWGDRVEVVLVDATGTVRNEGDADNFNCMLGCNNAYFAPGEGLFAAPGTRTVEVTATWTQPATAPGMLMELDYRTAADAPWEETEIRSGEPFVIQVGPEDADVPFAPISQWGFSFFPHATPAGSVPETDLAVRIVAKRGAGDLPVFGDPPDPWNGRTSVPLVAGAGGEQQIVYTPETFMCLECRLGWASAGGNLVGEGARSIEATVAWTWPGPAKPVLHYWNAIAGQQEIADVPLAQDGETSRTFVLEGIPPEQVDSPYQHRSTWGFWISFEGPAPAGVVVGTLSLDAAVRR